MLSNLSMIIGYGIYYFLNWVMTRLVVHRKTELKNIYFGNFFVIPVKNLMIIICM